MGQKNLFHFYFVTAERFIKVFVVKLIVDSFEPVRGNVLSKVFVCTFFNVL